MENICPICKNLLSESISDGYQGYSDLSCTKENHFYAERHQEGFLSEKKVRLKEDNNNYYWKVYNKYGVSEVWMNNQNRHTLNTINNLDLSDPNKALLKIKTYLMFL